ncbi:UNVERIFIED_CONTAM: hypothetical protein HHA_278753 [Hammondia hammondi]|eukprot:XP_008887146.1 hypothetical protein HHA_278753 [Hammondia hammondi]
MHECVYSADEVCNFRFFSTVGAFNPALRYMTVNAAHAPSAFRSPLAERPALECRVDSSEGRLLVIAGHLVSSRLFSFRLGTVSRSPPPSNGDKSWRASLTSCSRHNPTPPTLLPHFSPLLSLACTWQISLREQPAPQLRDFRGRRRRPDTRGAPGPLRAARGTLAGSGGFLRSTSSRWKFKDLTLTPGQSRTGADGFGSRGRSRSGGFSEVGVGGRGGGKGREIRRRVVSVGTKMPRVT